MNQEVVRELETALRAEHDKLVAELKMMARPDARGTGHWDTAYPQFEERETGSHSSADEEADEVEEYEVRLASEGTLETRLLNVNHALARIKDGTYGVCATCKKPIPLERLRANPAAEYDMRCSAADVTAP